MAGGGAKPGWSCNAADSIQWKFRVSNITKHLERVRSLKLKECSVFDCCNKASKVSSPANAKDCRAKQQHSVSILQSPVTEFVVKFIVIMVG